MDSTIVRDEASIENGLRLVMIERMLQEKYGEIEYLAIQPMRDPDIEEINKNDLEWLLSEHERCEFLEAEIRNISENYLNEIEELKRSSEQKISELTNRYNDLQHECEVIVGTKLWRWGRKITAPFRFIILKLRGEK